MNNYIVQACLFQIRIFQTIIWSMDKISFVRNIICLLSELVQVGSRSNYSNYSTTSNLHSKRARFIPIPHQDYRYDLVHPYSNDHTSCQLSLASAGHQIHAHSEFPDGGHKTWRTYLGDSSLGWA